MDIRLNVSPRLISNTANQERLNRPLYMHILLITQYIPMTANVFKLKLKLPNFSSRIAHFNKLAAVTVRNTRNTIYSRWGTFATAQALRDTIKTKCSSMKAHYHTNAVIIGFWGEFHGDLTLFPIWHARWNPSARSNCFFQLVSFFLRN